MEDIQSNPLRIRPTQHTEIFIIQKTRNGSRSLKELSFHIIQTPQDARHWSFFPTVALSSAAVSIVAVTGNSCFHEQRCRSLILSPPTTISIFPLSAMRDTAARGKARLFLMLTENQRRIISHCQQRGLCQTPLLAASAAP